MTIKTALKKSFSIKLIQQGFKYVNSLNGFLKIINEELVFYITFQLNPSIKKGCKAFMIYSGVLSIYCDDISREKLKMFSNDFAYWSYRFGKKSSCGSFGYDYNEYNIYDCIEVAIGETEEILIPALNDIYDLDSYINLRKLLRNVSPFFCADKFFNDSLALIKSNNHDDFSSILKAESTELKRLLSEKKSAEHTRNILIIYTMISNS